MTNGRVESKTNLFKLRALQFVLMMACISCAAASCPELANGICGQPSWYGSSRPNCCHDSTNVLCRTVWVDDSHVQYIGLPAVHCEFVCDYCPAGQEGLSGPDWSDCGACSNCAAGKYSSSAGMACTNCPSGYYQPYSGQTFCIECLSLTHCGGYGTDQYLADCGGASGGFCKDCQTCEAGKYMLNCGFMEEGSCEDCQGCTKGNQRVGCSGNDPGAVSYTHLTLPTNREG